MTETTPAKRGDLVVVHTQSNDWVNDSPGAGHTQTSEHFAVGVVTSVTRDGRVKLWREAGQLDNQRDHLGRPDRGQALPTVGFQQTWIMQAAQIDVPGALASAAVHTWDGHSTQVKAFASLDDVRAALRPHLHRSPGWEALHDAGETRLEAQRAAWAHYLATRTSDWHDPAFGIYEATIAAANATYRAALEARHRQRPAGAGLAASRAGASAGPQELSMTSEHAAAPATIRVDTPDGQATLSVVWCERDAELRPAETRALNHYPALRGARMLLRSMVPGTPDAFLVVERFNGASRYQDWQHVTTEMTERQARAWRQHQRPDTGARPRAIGPEPPCPPARGRTPGKPAAHCHCRPLRSLHLIGAT
jgi:hypothetical protein